MPRGGSGKPDGYELCKEADGTLSAVHMLGLSSAVCDEISTIVEEADDSLQLVEEPLDLDQRAEPWSSAWLGVGEELVVTVSDAVKAWWRLSDQLVGAVPSVIEPKRLRG